tara:strand:- start:137 stop:1060 length:924 start_codon:yes stop_codon:yes gene_type:complete
LSSLIHFISGPTGIGKSDLAIKLAKKINGKIINADSMQVYENLNILTARPSEKDLNEVEHKLYGHIPGSERYNVANWCNEASSFINQFSKKNIPVILVGGTGMYIEKLINGIVDIPSIPEEYKLKSEEKLAKVGIKDFYKLVYDLDKEATKKINPNDINRLKRIWEVFSYTKIQFSEWTRNKSKYFISSSDYLLYLFLPDRKKNYERVEKRFINMIKKGAIPEVEKLLKLNLDNSLPIMRAHGVPEISLFLQKKINLDECITKAQQVTRNYVKRQHTWWNSSNIRIQQKITEFPDQYDLNSLNFNQI